MTKPIGYALAGKKILLVDDCEDRRILFSNFLKVLQADCDTAADGATGLEMILNHSYDLIVLDVILDDILGWDVYKQLKAQKPGFDTPILFLTGLGEEAEEMFKALEAGPECQLQSKSIPTNDLVGVIESMLTFTPRV